MCSKLSFITRSQLITVTPLSAHAWARDSMSASILPAICATWPRENEKEIEKAKKEEEEEEEE
jgi:hypothetical protein